VNRLAFFCFSLSSTGKRERVLGYVVLCLFSNITISENCFRELEISSWRERVMGIVKRKFVLPTYLSFLVQKADLGDERGKKKRRQNKHMKLAS